MSARLRERRWLEGAGPGGWAVLGAAGWSALALIAALAGMGGRIEPAPLPAAEPLPGEAALPAERIGPYAQYREAEIRPLFATDRRPRPFVIAGQGGPAEPRQQPLNLQLTGVLISPRVQLATVQAPGGQPERVRLGQAPEGANGWRLVSLAPRSAVFESAEGRQTLELEVSGKTGPPTMVGVATTGMPPGAIPPPPPPPPSPVASDAPRPADAAAAAADQARRSVEEAAAEAEVAAMPPSQREQVDAIRRRIEARRAQMQQNSSTGGSKPPNP